MLSIQAHKTHHTLLDNASMGRREYWLWLLASGGTLIDGLSIFSLGVAMPLITSRFALSPLMVGLIGSALVLGAVFGAILGGGAADRFGRKPAFLIDMAIITAGALVSAAAGAPQWVLLGQFLVGIGVGIVFPSARPTCPKRRPNMPAAAWWWRRSLCNRSACCLAPLSISPFCGYGRAQPTGDP